MSADRRTSEERPRARLPRDALTRIHFGASFAEYDEVLRDPTVFVATPASIAALDPNKRKYFFVGRRGTGKTATGLHLLSEGRIFTQRFMKMKVTHSNSSRPCGGTCAKAPSTQI